jgi:uncharacterized protein with HEPN domain
MSKSDRLRTTLLQILETVETRFAPVTVPDDFTHSPEGKEKLDGICMQLIAIGESLKNVDKLTDKKLLNCYPEID